MEVEICQLLNILFLLQVACPICDGKIMRACFFKSDSRLRTNEAKFSVEDIDFTLCTHYVFGFVKVDVSNKNITAAEDATVNRGLFMQFQAGKNRNPTMKTILAIGGEEPSDDLAFENLYKKDTQFYFFVRNVFWFAMARSFNGIHIHWQVINNDMGKIALTRMLQEFRIYIDYSRCSGDFLLTTAGYPSDVFIRLRHNVTEIAKYVDYVFVFTKLLHSLNTASFFGALFNPSNGQNSAGSINDSIHAWKHHGMPYNKIVVSLTVLGHYIRLQSASHYSPFSQGTFDVRRGPKYNLENRLAFPEICEMMLSSSVYYDTVVKNPYLVKGDEWVGYLDVLSLRERIDYVRQMGLGGIQLENLDEDDFSGNACKAGRFPLVTAMRDTLDPLPRTAPTADTAAAWTTPVIETTPKDEEESTDHDIPNTTPPKDTRIIIIPKPGNVLPNSTESSVFRYLAFILLFTVGFFLGHVFMNFLRNTKKDDEQTTDTGKKRNSRKGQE